MADSYKRLAQGTFSSGTATTLYTVPAASTAIVKKIVLSNNSGAAATVKLHHVPDAGSPTSSNVILPTTTMQNNEHGSDEGVFVMETGETIRGIGDGTNAISYTIYGLVIS